MNLTEIEPNIDDYIENIKTICDFSDNHSYILMGIARPKCNEDITNSNKKQYRMVLTSEEEIEESIKDLFALMSRHNLYWRIYLSVNARNLLKGYFNLREKMNNWSRKIIEGDEESKEKLKYISSKWKSSLHQPQAKANDYFHFDLDDITEKECELFIESLPKQDGSEATTINESIFKYKQKTPNGYHIITEPFNYNDWSSPIEYDCLDTDGELHIAEFDNRE